MVTSIPLRAALAATLAVAACSAAPRGTADPTPPPFPIGQVGTPVHVKANSGATADVTLNSAAWFPPGCSGGWECNIIELTITGTSATPFKYSENYVVSDNGGGRSLGGDYQIDYTKINKLPPLRSGSVTGGQTAHGFIGYGCNLCEGDLNIRFDDPDQGGTTPEAGWKVHT